nr:ALI_HP1_G0023490.mRNA.1.CDS.1 [Saccharomyces cerevisiae]
MTSRNLSNNVATPTTTMVATIPKRSLTTATDLISKEVVNLDQTDITTVATIMVAVVAEVGHMGANSSNVPWTGYYNNYPVYYQPQQMAAAGSAPANQIPVEEKSPVPTKIEITTKSGEHLDLKEQHKAKLQSQERSTVSPQPESKLKKKLLILLLLLLQLLPLPLMTLRPVLKKIYLKLKRQEEISSSKLNFVKLL